MSLPSSCCESDRNPTERESQVLCFILFRPPRLVSVHVLAAGHRVVVLGAAELGIYCILFFCFRIRILVLVILYFCILFFCIFCHRVVVGGAELGGTPCYWLVCPLGKQGLVKRICEAFPHPRKKVGESLSGQVPQPTCICAAPKWNRDPKAIKKALVKDMS